MWAKNECKIHVPKNGLSAIFWLPFPKIGQKSCFWRKNSNFEVKLPENKSFPKYKLNIPQIGNHKYYNLGEFKKNCCARFFLNFTNAFFHNSQKTTFYVKISDKNVHKTSKSGAK